jgi:hypothetical protein
MDPDHPTGIGPLLAALDDDPLAREMAAPAQLYDLLARSDDPVWREIGQQLRDGRMDLRDVVQVEAYRRHLHRELTQHEHRFGDVISAARSYLEAGPGGGGARLSETSEVDASVAA